MYEPVVIVKNIKTVFGRQVVHEDVNFEIFPGRVIAIIGGSGTGKSVLLKEIIGLLRPTSGNISVLGVDIWNSPEDKLIEIKKRFGVLFQNGGLFSGFSVAENVALPYIEQTSLRGKIIKELVKSRLALAGLDPSLVSNKTPSELSGGMRKRVALARAIALEPELLFLDEPASGLDPISARAFDELIRTLAKSTNITVVMITHDLDSILNIADRVIVLGDGKVIADGKPTDLKRIGHPWIQEYFSSRVELRI